MRTTIAAAIAAVFALHPVAASAAICQTTTTSKPDAIVVLLTNHDDPDIPNCVMNPSTPYPNGVCERVLEWVNPALVTQTQPCNT